jgi:hypothetical protein
MGVLDRQLPISCLKASRCIYIHHNDDDTGFYISPPQTLRVVEAGRGATGNIVWGQERCSSYLFASSETADCSWGAHKAFDLTTGQKAWDFGDAHPSARRKVNESGDCMALQHSGTFSELLCESDIHPWI